MRIKTFRDNDSYFRFYNKMREKINLISVNITRTTIRMCYELKDE